MLALRDHLHRIRGKAFGVCGGFEGHRRIFLNQIRVGDLNHVKIAVVAVFIFDKSEAFIFKPRCDCTVHRCYRLSDLKTKVLQRAV
ncbi:Uncharacterised protein [Enterobacter cloacae]|nr:Uncharacterised protein [Enterobacter cloacae]